MGEWKRFQLCNLPACPPDRPSFRHTQCSQFDGMLYKGKLHKWVPVLNDGELCMDVEAQRWGMYGPQ